MNARLIFLGALLLASPALAQVPQQPGAPAETQLPPPRPPESVRPLEDARVVERDVARAAGAGNVALIEGRYEEALESYEQAQVIAPELPELEYNRGVSLLLRGEYEDAERALEQGLSLSLAGEGEVPAADPLLVGDGQFNLGHVAFGKQELDAAVRRFANALAAEPGSADARSNLELVLRAIEQQEQEQQDQQQEQDDQQQDQQDQQQQEQDQQDEQEQEDQQGEQDQEQEQEPGDEQEQDQQPQDQQEQEKEQQQQQPQPGEMSREQIEQLLDALAEEEREALRRKQEAEKKEALPAPGGKDW